MLDNQLIALIISLLRSGYDSLGPFTLASEDGFSIQSEDGFNIITDGGLVTVFIKQAYQPTQQGANTPPTIYLHKIGDRRIGSPFRSAVWNRISNQMIYTQLQQYETTFQISALVTQDPSDTNSLTASDIVNYGAFIMQSEDTITGLESQGVGVLRVQEVRNPYISDDRQRYEAAPSFDFTLTHKQTIITTVPILTAEKIQILPV